MDAIILSFDREPWQSSTPGVSQCRPYFSNYTFRVCINRHSDKDKEREKDDSHIEDARQSCKTDEKKPTFIEGTTQNIGVQRNRSRKEKRKEKHDTASVLWAHTHPRQRTHTRDQDIKERCTVMDTKTKYRACANVCGVHVST